MILFIGQVARGMREREAFQEVDYRQLFGGMAKWVVEIDDAARIPELIARAFRVAMQGRPGPVVVALPEDMLIDRSRSRTCRGSSPPRPGPLRPRWSGCARCWSRPKAPLVILGGSRWTETARGGHGAGASAATLPVATSFRRAALFPADHPNYAGDVGIGPNPKLAARVKSADLLILLGGRCRRCPHPPTR